MAFDVPKASPPPPTAILHAGDVSRDKPADADAAATATPTIAATPSVGPTSIAESTVVGVGALGGTQSPNGSGGSSGGSGLRDLGAEELSALSREDLVSLVIELQLELKAMQAL